MNKGVGCLQNRQPTHGCDTDVKLNRRNVLAGLGTAAAGTAAIFGTGAFVQETVQRDITVDVVDDDGDDVQLPITPNDETNGRVSTDNGVLQIDAEGLPEDATVTIGDFDIGTSMEDGAFTVENQNAFDEDIDLTVGLADADSNFGDIYLAVGDDAEQVAEDESTLIEDIGDEDAVDVGILIETTDDLGGETQISDTVTITLSAEVSE